MLDVKVGKIYIGETNKRKVKVLDEYTEINGEQYLKLEVLNTQGNEKKFLTCCKEYFQHLLFKEIKGKTK